MREAWGPALALAIGGAPCAPAKQQPAVMRAQGATDMTADELQSRLHDFTLRYGA